MCRLCVVICSPFPGNIFPNNPTRRSLRASTRKPANTAIRPSRSNDTQYYIWIPLTDFNLVWCGFYSSCRVCVCMGMCMSVYGDVCSNFSPLCIFLHTRTLMRRSSISAPRVGTHTHKHQYNTPHDPIYSHAPPSSSYVCRVVEHHTAPHRNIHSHSHTNTTQGMFNLRVFLSAECAGVCL